MVKSFKKIIKSARIFELTFFSLALLSGLLYAIAAWRDYPDETLFPLFEELCKISGLYALACTVLFWAIRRMKRQADRGSFWSQFLFSMPFWVLTAQLVLRNWPSQVETIIDLEKREAQYEIWGYPIEVAIGMALLMCIIASLLFLINIVFLTKKVVDFEKDSTNKTTKQS